MAHVITDACVGVKDGSCVKQCPVDCIHPTKGEAGYEQAPQLYIDPQQCICCGLCVTECPVSAIYPAEDLPPGKEHFKEVNARWFEQNR